MGYVLRKEIPIIPNKRIFSCLVAGGSEFENENAFPLQIATRRRYFVFNWQSVLDYQNENKSNKLQ